MTPLHEKESIQVNPQSSSPLYSGLIPTEIRTQIFDYVLTECVIPSPATNNFPHGFHPLMPLASLTNHLLHETSLGDYIPTQTYRRNSHYTRPGYTGRKVVHTALLQTCWQVYLETYHLPPAKKEHVFWHARGPPNHAGSTLSNHGEQEHRYFDMFTSWQMGFIKELHLFTQLFWLEKVFPRMAGAGFMQGMEHLKITIRRGDWWSWEHNKALAISPQGGHGDETKMYDEWALEKSGSAISWEDDKWGSAFKKMRNLKTLVIELETEDAKLVQLKDIIEHAKSWQFPAWTSKDDSEMVLRMSDEVSWSKWDAPPCYFASICVHCGNSLKCVLVDPVNPGCRERTERKRQDIGPLCHKAALMWHLTEKDRTKVVRSKISPEQIR